MRKYQKNLTVSEVEHLNGKYVLLKLTDIEPLPDILPGQFVEVLTPNNMTLLRRPISVNYVDRDNNQLWLLIAMIGDGTKAIGSLRPGEMLNLVFPLGNGFSPVRKVGEEVLLVGGGVGIAPLLEYGKYLKENGAKPFFLLGARTAADLLLIDKFESIAQVYVTTEDASAGEKGFVTQHSILQKKRFDRISVCGPKPMMVAIAAYAKQANISCEVSLENMMACGLGACLCCVEKTVKGNVCVCTEGPVFNINDLTWQI